MNLILCGKEDAVDRNEGAPIRPAQGQHPEPQAGPMLCVVIDFGRKLQLFGAVPLKQGIVNDEDVGTAIGIQWENGIVDDPGCKYCGKAYPVGLNHFHKTV